MYTEELEDLSPLDPKTWASVLVAHFDEHTTGKFYDSPALIAKLGSLEFLGPGVVATA